MSTFTVNLWVEIDANCIEEAWEIAESLPESLLGQIAEVGDVGLMHVEAVEDD